MTEGTAQRRARHGFAHFVQDVFIAWNLRMPSGVKEESVSCHDGAPTAQGHLEIWKRGATFHRAHPGSREIAMHSSVRLRGVSAMVTGFAVFAIWGAASVPTFSQDQGSQPPSQVQEPAAPARQQAPQTEAQLQQLVAPIALYPDNLLGQILAASTYPLEVVMATRWVQQNPGLKGSDLEAAMQQQPWDPSVKGLAAVPQVLQMMNDKLDWTQQLGEAYLAQPDDVSKAVQVLRARADATGNLKSSEQVKIKKVKPQPRTDVAVAVASPPPPPPPEYIMIEPAQPEVVYVPVYDPGVVYGPWLYPAYRPFFWYPPGYVYTGVFGYGPAYVVGPALWCRYDWYERRVYVDKVRYSQFNRVKLAGNGIVAWSHNPKHRGSVPYKNAALQKQFGSAKGTGAGFPGLQGGKGLPGGKGLAGKELPGSKGGLPGSKGLAAKGLPGSKGLPGGKGVAGKELTGSKGLPGSKGLAGKELTGSKGLAGGKAAGNKGIAGNANLNTAHGVAKSTGGNGQATITNSTVSNNAGLNNPAHTGNLQANAYRGGGGNPYAAGGSTPGGGQKFVGQQPRAMGGGGGAPRFAAPRGGGGGNKQKH